MDSVTSQDQQALLAQLARAEQRLDELVVELRGIDAELQALAVERDRHRLLESACTTLEQLGEIGGAGLFWDAAAGSGEQHLRRVRSRLDGFHKRIAEIEERRGTVLDAIEQEQVNSHRLDAEVFELREEEERRQQEWSVEREIGLLPASALMAWTYGGEADQRFRRSLAISLAASLMFALIVRQIDLRLAVVAEEAIAVPERVVRLMLQARPLPPPREEPPPQLAARTPPEEVVPEPSARPDSDPGPGEGPGAGPGKGILAFRERLSGIAELQSAARLGSKARISSTGSEKSGPPERALVASLAPGSSGGINLSSLSRDVGDGGGRIERIEVARATSAIGGGGRSDRSGDGAGSRSGPPLGRTDEEIQIVFDRHKAALYRLYNRELRSDPTLKGQMVLRIRIEPDGSVSLCELHATDMQRALQLSAQVVDRVRTFDFGAKEGIQAITILYPIDFLPAT